MRKLIFCFAIVFGASCFVSSAGCSKGGEVGDTVESPPRDLVEKSMPKSGGKTPANPAPQTSK